MNRRSFLSKLSAIAAASAVAPSAVKAATPGQQLQDAANEIHRQQSAGSSFIGMPLDQFIAAVKGNYPIAHRGTRTERGNTIVEFDVLATCHYAPPSWLDLGHGFPRSVISGDILAVYVRSDPVLDPSKGALVHGTSQWLTDS